MNDKALKWIKNIEIIEQGNKGRCPICGSDNIDYGFSVVIKETKMGFGAVWCNNCKNGFHISRIKINERMPLKDIPKYINWR